MAIVFYPLPSIKINKICQQQYSLIKMKPLHSLSFSCEQNRVEYQYVPQLSVNHHPFYEALNLNQLYEKSFSSSFLPTLQLHKISFNSINSSLSFDHNQEKNAKKQTKQQAELENHTKLEIQVSQIGDLGLDHLVFNKKMNTKNVLRNFGNAQNQYILHNRNAKSYIEQCLDNENQFFQWIRRLKLLNFEDYQNVWTYTDKDSQKQRRFKKIYKILCWHFYEQQCIPYIFNSRLSAQNKKSHHLQIYKMLKGIQNPKQFEGFKS